MFIDFRKAVKLAAQRQGVDCSQLIRGLLIQHNIITADGVANIVKIKI